MSYNDSEQSIRSTIRAATVGAQKQFASQTVSVNGVQVEVRQPSVRIRSEIVDSITEAKENGSGDRFGSIAIRRMCYVPGTDVLVFEDADVESIMAQPSGGWVDDLIAVCARLMNMVKPEDRAEKNSEATPAE